MFLINEVWMLVAHHGYHAFIEFIIDMSDHMVTHVLAIVVFKAGVAHVSVVAVKHVRKRVRKAKSLDSAEG